MRTLWLLFVTIVLFFKVENASAQDAASGEKLADRIRDVRSPVTLLLNDLEVIDSDVNRLFKDLDVGGQDASFRLQGPFDSTIDVSQGAIIYGLQIFGVPAAVEFQIRDNDRLPGWLSGGPAGAWKIPPSRVKGPLSRLIGGMDRVKVNGQRLISAKDASSSDEQPGFADEVVQAQPLGSRLDPTTHSIINDSGVSLLGRAVGRSEGVVIDWARLDNLYLEELEQLAPEEKAWLEQGEKVVQTIDTGVLGLKYHQRTFEIRAHAQTDKQLKFGSIMNTAKIERDWQPDLGLEPNGLMIAASMQLNAFPDSTALRVVPRLTFSGLGSTDDFRFLRGNMLRVLTELIGDSWNDLNAGRVAIYRPLHPTSNQEVVLFGIADAGDPAIVMTELRRISKLTQPADQKQINEELEAEFKRLAADLDMENYSIRYRAQTRFVLGGKRAETYLKRDGMNWTDRQKRAIAEIVDRINYRMETGVAAFDPSFWTTLNPGLQLNESTHKVGGFEAHTIAVTPDPSKTKDEVDEASAMMTSIFGPTWNAVQVVQVRNHFVFMIGSDSQRLETIVANLDQQKCQLIAALEPEAVHGTEGQFQMFVQPVDVNRYYRRPNRRPQDDDVETKELCWIRLNISNDGPTVTCVLPTQLIIPFMSGF